MSLSSKLPFEASALLKLVTLAGGERETHPVIAPFTAEAIAEIPYCTPADVAHAVVRARAVQAQWFRLGFKRQRQVLLRFHGLLFKYKEGLLDLLQIEGGKSRKHALEEVLDIIICSRYYAFRAEKYLQPQARLGALPFFTRTRVIHTPVGVVGIIAPWNYPLSLSAGDALPALAAGNAVILKPSEKTPLMALAVLRLLLEAGLPEGVFQVVTGDGPGAGAALLEAVDFIQFTGSNRTGRQVALKAAERLIPCSLELGGKNAAVVLDDADLGSAAEGVVRGTYSNAGQLCISFERLYVQERVYDAFLKIFLPKVKALKLGSALDYGPDVGSLLSGEQLAKTEAHVADALSKGARVLAGAKARPDLGPFFYEPTVLAGVLPGMRAYGEETFGPVLSVYRFTTDEEAIALVNGSEFGLNASVFGRSRSRVWKLARRIQAGTVNINEAYAASWGSLDAPMGGMKQSGLGRRHGREGIVKFTEAQTISAQRLLPIDFLKGVKPDISAGLIALYLRMVRYIPGLR